MLEIFNDIYAVLYQGKNYLTSFAIERPDPGTAMLSITIVHHDNSL